MIVSFYRLVFFVEFLSHLFFIFLEWIGCRLIPTYLYTCTHELELENNCPLFSHFFTSVLALQANGLIHVGIKTEIIVIWEVKF